MTAQKRLLILSALLALGVAQAAESPTIHPAIQAAVDSQERFEVCALAQKRVDSKLKRPAILCRLLEYGEASGRADNRNLVLRPYVIGNEAK